MTVKDDTEKKMKNALEFFREELRTLRSGRAHPSMLDTVLVEVYGSTMKVKELAQVNVAESRQLVISPFDPQTAASIAKGIEKANLGFLPAVDGNVIRVPVPPMTEDIRKETVKQAKKKAEDAKVQIRQVRKESNDLVKKQKSDNEIAEDVQKKLEKQIQDLTDKYCKEVDTLFSEKERDIMEV